MKASVTAWSRRAGTRHDDASLVAQPTQPGTPLWLEPGTGFYRGTLRVDAPGAVALHVRSPRPIRLWLGGERLLDEPLHWRSFQREVRACALMSLPAGEHELLVEVGERPGHPASVERDCPSRNRQAVLQAIRERLPDAVDLDPRLLPDVRLPACALRFGPAQFHRDGMTWQQIVLWTPGSDAPPGTQARNLGEVAPPDVRLSSAAAPGLLHEAADESERRTRGVRQFYVPVTAAGELLPALRAPGEDHRCEPYADIGRHVELTVQGGQGSAAIAMPVFESLGRLAPQREFREVRFPPLEELLAGVPEPILPPEWKGFRRLYDAAWEMLLRLVLPMRPEGGFPNRRVCTGASFGQFQFLWDTSFTAMATAYGCRAFPVYASLDVLYSRQFDGGYIHREYDGYDGLPIVFEPDFSPNPPILSVAEWQIAQLSGRTDRLRCVYPALAQNGEWLWNHRRLPNGTFWTTGLANGLDNSPSLGDGYPDLTAQMVHNAEVLASMAELLGFEEEEARWRARRDETAEALNRHCWSEPLQFYSTWLEAGGHNPNKVVTGFWPLWAGAVPAERVEALARHLKDPASFWRHHPLPSLAADSPHFVPEGQYWLGSTWAPTNYAAIKGFQRAGRHDLAFEAALRHVTCMWEVFQETGRIWENYCSEASHPGNWSGADYCWSALGPIALLLETIIGIEPEALRNRLVWTPPAGRDIGVNRYPLGGAMLALRQQPAGTRDRIVVITDFPVTVELRRGAAVQVLACQAGQTMSELARD